MQLHALYQYYLQNPTICIDTRKITEGCLFFALKGPNFNGNAFAKEALERGAQWVIIDEERFKISEQCILVEDVLSCLQQLATYHRKQLNIPFLAITGRCRGNVRLAMQMALRARQLPSHHPR